jgi:hypothetical protein
VADGTPASIPIEHPSPHLVFSVSYIDLTPSPPLCTYCRRPPRLSLDSLRYRMQLGLTIHNTRAILAFVSDCLSRACAVLGRGGSNIRMKRRNTEDEDLEHEDVIMDFRDMSIR